MQRRLLPLLGLLLPLALASGHASHHEPARASFFPDLPASTWLRAFAGTGAISLFPTLILPVIPMVVRQKGGVGVDPDVQKVLLSFAAGGLMGEVFMHCIPHLMEGSHGHHGVKGEGAGTGNATHAHDHHDQAAAHDHHHHDDHASGHDHHHDGHDHHHHHEEAEVGTCENQEVCEGEHAHSHGGHSRGGHSHSPEATMTSLFILAGFLAFFIAEKIVKAVRDLNLPVLGFSGSSAAEQALHHDWAISHGVAATTHASGCS
jgi:hypothetical protein